MTSGAGGRHPLGGRFRLEREIGTGGMSVVFLGHDEVLDRPVAVKILKGGLDADPEVGARFRREGRTAARLSHPNTVPVYDAGEDDFDGREASYIVMEYLPGGDLKGLVERKGPLGEEELVRIGAAVASGLALAHEKGVVHRDVKPHNVLLDEHGRPKLADFGIARALDTTQATRTGSYLGTALYSSPEQLRGEEVTAKSDVYSLGVTLYYAATGEPPFSGDGLSVAHQHVSKLPVVPTARGAVLGVELENVILACMEKDPRARPTAEDLAERLLRASASSADTAALAGTDAAETAAPNATVRDGSTGSMGTAGDNVAGAVAGAAAGAAGAARVVGDSAARGLEAVAQRMRDRTATVPAGTAPASRDAPGRTFRPERDRRVVLLAAAAALLILTAAAFALLHPGQDETAGQQPPPSEEAVPPPAEERNPEEPPPAEETTTAPEQVAGRVPGARAAEQAVFDMYVQESYQTPRTSFAYLSGRLRDEVGSPEDWGEREGIYTLWDVYFTGYPQARVSGEEAEVRFEVRLFRTGQTELLSGTWVCVVEDGKWKLDRLENEKTEAY